MNDTPRVTVPVEPEFSHYRRSQIAHLRPYVAGEVLSDRVSISAADLEDGSPKPGDMIARNPANHDDQWLVAADYFAANFEPISAAPAPEGGAVWSEYIRLLEGKIKQWTDPDYLGDDRLEVDDALELADAIKAALSALATRDESPAEAGEAKQLDRLFYAGGEYVRADEAVRQVSELKAELSALRAQPPAREDAQPVAWRFRHVGQRMVGVAMYIKEAELKAASGWEVEPLGLITHPAPDALRAAVEALEPFAKGGHHRTMPGLSPSYTVADFGDGVVVTVADFRRAAEAFAALQAEQKGGA